MNKTALKRMGDSKCVQCVLVFLICVVLGACLCMIRVFGNDHLDMDMMWHFKLGGDIWKTKTLSLDNPYTFLSGTEWIPHEWLYEVLLYPILAFGGILGFAVLYAANRVSWFFISYKIAKPKSVVFYLLMFIALEETLSMNRGNRPAELSLCLFLCMFYFYWSQSNYKWIWYTLFGIFMANFHGGMVVIFACVHVILMAVDLFTDIYKHELSGKRYYARHALCLLLFLAAALINPAGYRLYTDGILVMFSPITQYIIEWRSPGFSWFSGGLILLTVVSFGYVLHKHHFERRMIQKVAVMLALLLLSLMSMKSLILYFITYMAFGSNYTYEMLKDIWTIIVCRWTNKDKLDKLPYMPKNAKYATILYVSFICLFMTGSECNWLKDVNLSASFKDYMSSQYSEYILARLKSDYTEDTKILTSYNYGNLLILNDMKCFVDTREWCYDSALTDCDAVDDLMYVCYNMQDIKAVEAFLDKYDFDYIWTNDRFRLNTYLDGCEDYKLVCEYKPIKDAEHLYERSSAEYECLYQKVR